MALIIWVRLTVGQLALNQLIGVRITDPKHMVEVLDFYADWCVPCKQLEPLLKEVLIGFPSVRVLKIDIDKDQTMVKQFNVQSIPTLIFLKEGVEIKRVVGSIDKAGLLREFTDQ